MRRSRKHSPHIPAHIDQAAIPAAVYFDPRWSGVWYTTWRDEGGKRKRINIAGATATLADLHRIMEERKGIDRESLNHLCEEFHKSSQCKGRFPPPHLQDRHSQALLPRAGGSRTQRLPKRPLH